MPGMSPQGRHRQSSAEQTRESCKVTLHRKHRKKENDDETKLRQRKSWKWTVAAAYLLSCEQRLVEVLQNAR